MPIYKYPSIDRQVLVCKKCGCPVEKGFSRWYSCAKCNCWVMAVIWKDQSTT